MSSANGLRETVAKLLQVAPEEITAESSLAAFSSSLAGTRLGLALKRIGLQLPGNQAPATFGALEALLNGGVAPVAAVTAVVPVAAASGLQVGLDIQEIDALPVADDYWEHEFYHEIFDRSEIAYAVIQAEPRAHLAGFWCAKEALRKCDASFAGVGFGSIAVSHDAGGRPFLLSVGAGGRVRLPHALSISHSGRMASAVVVSLQPARPALTSLR